MSQHRPVHHQAVLESFARLSRTLSRAVIGVYVTGSALRDDFGAASDLDVTVLCDRRVSLEIELKLLHAAHVYSALSSTVDLRVLASRRLTLLERHQLSRHSLAMWGTPVRPPPSAPDSEELLDAMRRLARSALERSSRAEGSQRARLWAKGTLRLLYLDHVRRDCAGLGPRQMLVDLLASRVPRSVKQTATTAFSTNCTPTFCSELPQTTG